MDEYRDYPYKQQFQPWFDPGLGHHPLDEPPPAPSMTLAGNLDPATGIFYRAPEHPRLRTAQACDKCRARKAKVFLQFCRRSRLIRIWRMQCSGEHPSCARCLARGLPCAYAKEGRVRGPNKTKSRSGSVASASSHISHSLQSHSADDLQRLQGLVNVNVKKARRNTTLGTSVLEPLSSCEPLVLPPKHPNNNGLHTDRYRGQRQQEQHLLPLPTSASKRLSLPASLSLGPAGLGHQSAHGLSLLSSAHPQYGYGNDECSNPGSAYTDSSSRRGSFDPLFALERPLHHHQHQQTKGYERSQKKGAPGYDGNSYDPDPSYDGGLGLDRRAPMIDPALVDLDHRAPFPLDAGYAFELSSPLREYPPSSLHSSLPPPPHAHSSSSFPAHAHSSSRGLGLGRSPTTRHAAGGASGVGRPAISLDMDLGRGRSMSSGSEGDESA
ncbi:hypothetical protein DFH08DRAFT_154610 [Mycena albidolilacea]|uniref:Zn(2)-C6 fungal-type domain-containing protein n=1 Tax=Mycena albidolilacea TaxID=1033008 RepID=A0AAD7ERX8_9AGAR|nr:hypothetical protein DFH08DRAFT_154610 [Mycena albidolilacea]